MTHSFLLNGLIVRNFYNTSIFFFLTKKQKRLNTEFEVERACCPRSSGGRREEFLDGPDILSA